MMSNPNALFDLPAVPMKKLSLKEFLNHLRDRINCHYMPSSKRATEFNSKPEYVKHQMVGEFADFPRVHENDSSGYYCFSQKWSGSDGQAIFFNLKVTGFQILINLKTEQAIVRNLSLTPEFVLWPDEADKTLAIDRLEYHDAIDVYT